MDAFESRVAIVTGGASGIGRALCEELAQRGASVTVADINLEGARRVTASLDGARAAHLDVTQEADMRALIEDTASAQGRLDYVFNNAGICMVGEVRDMRIAQWRRIVDVNVWGVIYGTMAAYRVMLRQGSGHIVNTASADGLMPFPMMTAYSMTKHAVIGLSTSLRAEAADLGVKVSVACPGAIRTGMQDALTVVSEVKDRDALRDLIPDRMMMDAEDCARVILRGVARNRGIIPVTAFARLCWWLYRLHPALIRPLNRYWIEVGRALRQDAV